MKKRSVVAILSLLVLMLGATLVPVMAQDEEMQIPEPALVYDIPEGYQAQEVLSNVDAGNGHLEMGDETILIFGPDAYSQIISGQEFDDDQAALDFYMKRAGYTVGDAGDVNNDNVLAVSRVSLARRQQSGQAYLVDLGVGLQAVVVSLHTGRGRVGAPAADTNTVLDSIAFPMDVVQAATAEGSFTTFVAALEATGLDMTLHGEGPFTVFAPTDDAFEALYNSLGITEEQLLSADYLESVLLYHIVSGNVDSATLTENYLDQTSIATLLPVNNVFAFTGVDGLLYINNSQSQIVTTDITATNGVIHALNGVLLPQCAIDSINGEGGC